MSDWNPEQYERFAKERRRPFCDLLDGVQPLIGSAAGGRALDLGCGTGELTRVMHERVRANQTVGVDASEAMLARAAEHAGDGLSFCRAAIEAYEPPGPVDLIFSNAALHWVPDHDGLMGRLTRYLAPGGQLAVQVPANHDHDSHVLADEVAREPELAAALGGYQRGVPVLDPRRYAELLDELGYATQRVEMRIYGHHLPSPDAVIEWVAGSLLTAYQERLTPELFERYQARYRERLLERLPDRRPYFYTYKRILMWARRGA